MGWNHPRTLDYLPDYVNNNYFGTIDGFTYAGFDELEVKNENTGENTARTADATGRQLWYAWTKHPSR
jgi:hypothetical protein